MPTKALVFISYHPGSLVNLDHIRIRDNGHASSVLILCKHGYHTDKIIELYSKKFDYFIFLPDVSYENNVITGCLHLIRYIRKFNRKIRPFIEKVDSFDIVSDCSAYLPVNVILSRLMPHKKRNKLLSIRNDISFKRKISFLRTMPTVFYTFLFKLYPVYAHKQTGYLYLKEPARNMIIKFRNPAVKNINMDTQDKMKKINYFIDRPRIIDTNERKDIVLVYSGLTLPDFYKCNLSKQEYEEKLVIFFKELAKYYHDCKIIANTHPHDNNKIMPGLDKIKCEVYKGGLMAPMFVEQNIKKIRACYTVTSTAVLYSAERFIPSYAAYKYLGFSSEVLGLFFESEEVQCNPLFFNIQDVGEIGSIDLLKSGQSDNMEDDYEGIMK